MTTTAPLALLRTFERLKARANAVAAIGSIAGLPARDLQDAETQRRIRRGYETRGRDGILAYVKRAES